MSAWPEPFADELLSSWLDRRRQGQRQSIEPDFRAYRDARGHWRHPDVQPQQAMIHALASRYDVALDKIDHLALGFRYQKIGNPFIAWHYFPPDYFVWGSTPRPTLRRAWCSRCLAEDFAADRTAYARADWVVAAWSFCPRHRWPLIDRCITCGSGNWIIKRAPRGPPRMFCTNCHRPLERAHPKALKVETAARPFWDKIAAFEAALRGALAGKVPDQFRFNNTSARQLLEETSEICLLLGRCHARLGLRDLLFERFASPALTLSEDCYQDLPFEMPLALAELPLRRSLLAICAAILDSGFDTANVRPEDGEPAVDLLALIASDSAVDRFVRDRRVCSPTLKKQVAIARQRNETRERIWALRRAVKSLEGIFLSGG